MSGWLDAVCRAGVFILCAQVLIHCRPNSSYEKYLKMLVSAMILLQLFLPVSRLLSGTGEADIQEDMDWFRIQMQEMEERSGAILHMDISGRDAGSGQIAIENIGEIDRVEIAPIQVGEGWENETD